MGFVRQCRVGQFNQIVQNEDQGYCYCAAEKPNPKIGDQPPGRQTKLIRQRVAGDLEKEQNGGNLNRENRDQYPQCPAVQRQKLFRRRLGRDLQRFFAIEPIKEAGFFEDAVGNDRRRINEHHCEQDFEAAPRDESMALNRSKFTNDVGSRQSKKDESESCKSDEHSTKNQLQLQFTQFRHFGSSLFKQMEVQFNPSYSAKSSR